MQHKSFGGSRYFLTFIDDYTRKVFVYFLKSKDEVLDYFKTFKNFAEKQMDLKIKKLRTGCECVNNEFKKFLQNAGIKHKISVFTLEQNGIAERYNRSIVTRCMIFDANIEIAF